MFSFICYFLSKIHEDTKIRDSILKIQYFHDKSKNIYDYLSERLHKIILSTFRFRRNTKNVNRLN